MKNPDLQRIILKIIKANVRCDKGTIVNKATRQYWPDAKDVSHHKYIEHNLELLVNDGKVYIEESSGGQFANPQYSLTTSGHQTFEPWYIKLWRFILFDNHNLFIVLSWLISLAALIVSIIALKD